MVRVHLDTDIGGDIDDLCALALLLRWPDAELVALTTVQDEGGRRAGSARYALALDGRDDVPVAAGSDVASGRFRELPTYPDERAYWPQPIAPAPGPLAAALDLLQSSIESGATIVGIGPFTNLALLEERTPGILADARIVLMGGYVRPIRPGYPNWPYTYDYNVQQDIAAARPVIERGGKPVIVPMTITMETAFRAAYLPGLRRAGPLGALLARQGEAHDAEYQTAARYGATCSGLPDDILNFQHDPLAVAVALGWDGVTIERLPLLLHEQDGYLREEERPGGRPTDVVTAVEGERFNEFWYRTIVGA
jgi:purine nucleosidase